MTPTRVEITIDELVLHGFAPGERYALAEALQQELTRLFVEQGVPAAFARGGETERLDLGSFPLATDTQANAVGIGVAAAVYGGPKA